MEPERDFQVKQVTFAEVMENRGASAVLEAVGRMVAKLNFLGLPLKRLHSDRAGEYQSKMFDKWVRDRGICRTFTDGDNFKGNGRAEGAVAQLKRGARTLLVAAGLDESYWCHASRHWADTRLRSQLESMGWKRRQLATFGQVVWAKRKLYSDRQKYLSTTRTQVRVLCPAVTMSMTSPGYFVEELATGKLFHTADIIQVEDMPEGLELPDREAGEIHEVDDREETQQPGKDTWKGQTPPVGDGDGVRRLGGAAAQRSTDAVSGASTAGRGLRGSQEREIPEGSHGGSRGDQPRSSSSEPAGGEEHDRGDREEVRRCPRVPPDSNGGPVEEWKPSMCEEYGALVEEPEAVEPISREKMVELREEAQSSGRTFDLLPAKAIFSRKAGSGRRKCRGVACGNYMKLRSDESTFASGAGGPGARLLLKIAATKGWSASTVDVKTAFLNAPVDNAADRRVVIVEPPRVFRDAQVLRHPEELWLVRKALYGLTTSPKDWRLHRDKCIQEFNWRGETTTYKVEKTAQDDVWGIYGHQNGEGDWKLAGLCATYVDDIIITGVREVIEGMRQKIRESWKIGEPSWIEDGGDPVRFLRMEIEKKGQDFAIHQRAYLESLFMEYDEQGKASLGQVKTPEEEERAQLSEVTQAGRGQGAPTEPLRRGPQDLQGRPSGTAGG